MIFGYKFATGSKGVDPMTADLFTGKDEIDREEDINGLSVEKPTAQTALNSHSRRNRSRARIRKARTRVLTP
jgi:hypothetical protein